MASNQEASDSKAGMILKICPSSCSPKLLSKSPSTPPPSSLGLTMDLSPDNHRSALLTPEMKHFYNKVFQALPQAPHFSPLEGCRSEKVKEGIKLGCDIALLQLVHKFQNTIDPCAFFKVESSFTQEFEELEKYGYDLTSLKQRFILMMMKAQEVEELNEKAERLEEEKIKREIKIGNHEVCLVELAQESVRVASELKRERSELDCIEDKKRKMILDEDDSDMSDFKKLSSSPW